MDHRTATTRRYFMEPDAPDRQPVLYERSPEGQFFPAGGGLVCSEARAARLVPATQEALAAQRLVQQLAVSADDDDDDPFWARVDGARWNGWLMPLFDAEQVARVVERYYPPDNPDNPVRVLIRDLRTEVERPFDPQAPNLRATDAVVFEYLDEDGVRELIEPQFPEGVDGPACWRIGGGSLTWDVVALPEDEAFAVLDMNGPTGPKAGDRGPGF